MPFLPRHFSLRAGVMLLFAATLFNGCKKPIAGDAYTLNAPSDVEGVGICFYEDDETIIAEHADSDNCIHPAELVPSERGDTWHAHMYLAAITNYGENALQLYTLDTRSTIWLTAVRSALGAECLQREIAVRQPIITEDDQWIVEANGDDACSSIIGSGVRSFDNQRGTPGNSGIRLDGQIENNVPSHFPGIQWVSTSSPNTLAAVNLLTGDRVEGLNGAKQQFVDFPISDLVSVQDGGWLVAANPRDNELVAYQPTIYCGAQTERHEVGCNLAIELGEATHIALDGSPRHLAASEQGDIYVSAETTPYIARVSLNDEACPVHSPCKIPLTHTCNDGIDNDGNGLIDAEDPSCYAPWMNEGEIFADAPCADGIDNDGDGLIDALDPECLWRNFGSEDGTDNSCSDGIDNDGDGLIDSDDPACANGSEFGYNGQFTPPQNISIPRYESTPVYPGPIALSDEGDILIVAENGGTRAKEGSPSDLVFLCGRPLDDDDRPADHACDEPNTLLNLNQGDPARNKGVGLQIPSGIQSLVVSNRTERMPIRNEDDLSADGDHPADVVSLQVRRVYAAASDGRIYSIDIDESHAFVDESGQHGTEYTPLFRYTDRNNSYADVRNMRLRNAERLPALPDGTAGDPNGPGLQPSLLAIDPDELSVQTGSSTYLARENLTKPEAFIRLPREERFCFDSEGIDCLTNPPRDSQFRPYEFARERQSLKNDARVFDENWTLAWEGSLPIDRPNRSRNDAVILDDDGWIHFLGQDTCDVVGGDTQRLCDMNVGWSVCPELEDLCESGADVCGGTIDICDVCPRACASEVDLCEAGVQPGDIAIIPPMATTSYCLRHEENCNSQTDIPEQCLDGNSDEPGAFGTVASGQATVGNEYRVVEVQGDSIRVEPLDFNDRARYRLPSTLPSTDCYRRPFTVEIAAANAWTLHGSRLLSGDSPYVNVDNACVYEADVEDNLRNWRPSEGTTVLTRFGFEFQIAAGDYLNYCHTVASNPEECAHAMRGFQIRFATEDNLTPRTLIDLVGNMGISASRVTNLNALNKQLLFIDAGRNFLSVVNDNTSMRATVVP